MESLHNEFFLKELSEEAESLKKEIAHKRTNLTLIAHDNNSLQKNVQWLENFSELADKRDAMRAKLFESSSEIQFIDLVGKIFDNCFNTVPKNDGVMDMKPFVKTIDELIENTESVMNFYNDIPIVQTYKSLNTEYEDIKATLRSSEQINPILKHDIQHFNLLCKERNRIIVNMVTNTGKIENITKKITTITNDLNKTILHKNEVQKDLQKKIEELQNKQEEAKIINKVPSKLTLSHIDIFKIPSCPAKLLKNTVMQNKFKENENRSGTKRPIKTVPTFPILPLYRNPNRITIEEKVNSPKLKIKENVQIIENLQLKPVKLKTGQDIESTTSKFKLLDTKITNEFRVTNIETSNKNAKDKPESFIIPPTESKNKSIQGSEVIQNLVQQKHQSSELKKKKIEEQIKSDNITISSFMDEGERGFKEAELVYPKAQYINKSEIPIETNDAKNKPNFALKYLTSQSTNSKIVPIVSPKKRLLSDFDCLTNKKITLDENKIPNSSNYTKEMDPNHPSENGEQKTEAKQVEQKTESKDVQQNTESKHVFNVDSDEISSVDSVNSDKEPDESGFNFDDGNMNFDEIGNGNSFFDSAGDLDFSSDNQFGADCDSFKF